MQIRLLLVDDFKITTKNNFDIINDNSNNNLLNKGGCHTGVSASLVSGSRPLDEVRVGVLAGLATGLGLSFAGLYPTLGPVYLWAFGVALPGLLAGFAARYATTARRQWIGYWADREQSS